MVIFGCQVTTRWSADSVYTGPTTPKGDDMEVLVVEAMFPSGSEKKGTLSSIVLPVHTDDYPVFKTIKTSRLYQVSAGK